MSRRVLYAEAFTIAKPVTVLGPNDNISPNAGERVAEAVLQGSTASGLSECVALDSTGVVLRGLTFDNLRIDSYNDNAHEQITGDVIAFNRFVNVLGTPIYLRDGRNEPGKYSTGVVVQDNYIDSPASAGSADFNAGSGIIVMGAEALVIKDNVILSAAYNGIQLGRCNGVVLQNNTATGCAQPALQIAQWNDGAFAISGNTFSTLSTTKAAVRLYGFTNNYNPLFTFTDNTIRDSKYGVQIGREDAGKGYNDIRDADYAFSGNTFANIESYRLLVYLSTAATAAEREEMDALFAQTYAAGSMASAITTVDPFTYVAVPNPVWVDDSFTAESCDGHIWGYDAFTTIQAGVNAVTEGGTVHVLAGTYSENVALDKPLTLAGSAAATSPCWSA
jgi:parallel beta-helix repeat protein